MQKHTKVEVGKYSVV